MPKTTPKRKEGSNIFSPEDFMGGAVASNAEKNTIAAAPKTVVAAEQQDLTARVNTKSKGRAEKKETILFVGVRIPESTAFMLEEYDQNYALRGESKNSIMSEGIRKEISARLQKAKKSRAGEES